MIAAGLIAGGKSPYYRHASAKAVQRKQSLFRNWAALATVIGEPILIETPHVSAEPISGKRPNQQTEDYIEEHQPVRLLLYDG